MKSKLNLNMLIMINQSRACVLTIRNLTIVVLPNQKVIYLFKLYLTESGIRHLPFFIKLKIKKIKPKIRRKIKIVLNLNLAMNLMQIILMNMLNKIILIRKITH